MMPVDFDHSLRTGEPTRESLDDGFSPPSGERTHHSDEIFRPTSPADALTAKSLF